MQAAPATITATRPAPASGLPPTSEASIPSSQGVGSAREHDSPTSADDARPGFARPDWSELRLRSMAGEPTVTPRWLVLITILLAITALGQAGYLWYLRQANVVPDTGQLRVDGPEGAQVRVDGRPIGPAPIEHALAAGDYQVEIISGQSVSRSQRVSVGVGRTVVLVPLDAGNATRAPTPTAQATTTPSIPGGAPAVRQPPTAPAAATGAAGVSATHGAVVIESTPSGLPVTMEGRERGVTPITIGQLKPGRHDVLVGGLARKVDIAANQVATLRVTRP